MVNQLKSQSVYNPSDYPSDTFCILPWTHIAIDPIGDVMPCCNAKFRGEMGMKQVETMNVNYDKIADIWNSEFFKTLRMEFLNGIEPVLCEKCFHTERLGNHSMRTEALTNPDYFHFEPLSLQILESKKTNGYTELKPSSLDLRLGNLCNLKCRMCGPNNSSQINNENKILSKIYPDTPTKTTGRFRVVNDKFFQWPTQESFWEDLNKNTPNLEKIYFVGGEPTLHEQHYELLERLVLTNKAKNIMLDYNINCTNVQDRFIKLINEFKRVSLGLSIDGVGELNNYIRHPSKWDNIEANVDRLIYETKSNVRIDIIPTLQALNALRILGLFDWFLEKNKIPVYHKPPGRPDWEKEPKINFYLNAAVTPEHASFYAIPISVRTHYINNNKERIDQLLETLSQLHIAKKIWGPTLQSVHKYVNFMLEKHETSAEKFIEYTKILDKHRNENLFDVLPEYRQYFS